ncbi:molybdopterin-synthase adenylyltransferase MoeB [Vibrio ostreicida]|uniref:Molybdopterin-synthase adenylyltransferase MoeB n=1 Tax=Vibrio ostreicida TaxID=526588 RepID=A0ABT8BUS1_9VIBR|nr:molybdopterin-synthase adenylyltransferase MoeB [Vibrio ostreicida]MDN3610408.1 molybdopterin-synthase adenylyltransferase MoeB [Vibrio ostreicida]NPD07582.1 molybdopterin-synthase adenylyltransferase MoeB [Vibrio ostreicida]
MALTREELTRYSRHLVLPEVGLAGQEKLKNAKVLVVGTGGLGSPILLYLAASGIGTIGLVDFDTVDETNLQRQILFDMGCVGESKSSIAKQRLTALNPYITVHEYNTAIDQDNALEMIGPYDVVVDGTDNFTSRYLVNDACVLLGKPYIYGSVFRFEGQVAVMNALLSEGQRGACYRCLFPEPPPAELVPNCSEGGVLGVLPAIIGSLQATETIKIICGIGQSLSRQLILYNALDLDFKKVNLVKDPSCPICSEKPTITELHAIEVSCQAKTEDERVSVLSVLALQERLDKQEPLQLLDVRQDYERDIVHIGGKHIPLQQLEAMTASDLCMFDPQVPLVVYCKAGARSEKAITRLQELRDFKEIYSLKGGVLKWVEDIDPSLNSY